MFAAARRIDDFSRALTAGTTTAQRRAVSASFALRVWSALAMFLITMLLAKAMGAAAFGAYSFALGWVSILLVLTTFGFQHFNVREIARLIAIDRPAEIAGLIILSATVGGLLSGALALGAPWLAANLPLSPDPALEEAFIFGAFLIPLLTFNSLRQGVLRGFGRPVLGQLPDLGLVPGVMLALVVVALFANVTLTAKTALWLNIISAAVAFLIGIGLLKRETWRQGLRWHATFKPRRWIRGAGYSLIIGAAATINNSTDLVMLGALTDAEQTGVYGLAVRFALVTSLPVLAVTSGLSHEVSRLFNRDRIDDLGMLARGAGRLVVALTSAMAVAISLVTPVIGALFGPEFAAASIPILILVWARVLETLAGQPSMVLINTRFAGLGAICISAVAVLNIGLNLALIPLFGVVGAASATALAQLTQALVMLHVTRRKLGFATAPFARATGSAESRPEFS
jgi:O-antigen/teichoic acid export membrane protein